MTLMAKAAKKKARVAKARAAKRTANRRLSNDLVEARAERAGARLARAFIVSLEKELGLQAG